jgi:hypothetical protein
VRRYMATLQRFAKKFPTFGAFPSFRCSVGGRAGVASADVRA